MKLGLSIVVFPGVAAGECWSVLCRAGCWRGVHPDDSVHRNEGTLPYPAGIATLPTALLRQLWQWVLLLPLPLDKKPWVLYWPLAWQPCCEFTDEMQWQRTLFSTPPTRSVNLERVFSIFSAVLHRPLGITKLQVCPFIPWCCRATSSFARLFSANLCIPYADLKFHIDKYIMSNWPYEWNDVGAKKLCSVKPVLSPIQTHALSRTSWGELKW